MDRRSHWEGVYRAKRPDEVSWFRPHLERSLALIRSAAPSPRARIVDVGAGEATLVDDLLEAGYAAVDVLDLSETAIRVARERLGDRSAVVRWLVGDVTTFAFEAAAYDVWHDRAVFHFLTRAEDRAAYVAQVRRAVKPGGHVLVATFGLAGPRQCSGLDVVRYDAAGLHAELGADFVLLQHEAEAHVTPAGAVQQFVYCLCRR